MGGDGGSKDGWSRRYAKGTDINNKKSLVGAASLAGSIEHERGVKFMDAVWGAEYQDGSEEVIKLKLTS